jgi:hypothetical protein
MRKLALLVAATATLSAVALAPTTADAGCYRLGLTGYHWYRFAGPGFIYPHIAGMAIAGIARAHKTCLVSNRTRQGRAMRRQVA